MTLNLQIVHFDTNPFTLCPIGPLKATGDTLQPSSARNTWRKSSSLQCSKHIDHCNRLLQSSSKHFMAPL